jgi:hypothetical protein
MREISVVLLMSIVFFLTAISTSLSADIETTCGHVRVQSGNHISLKTDEGKVVSVVPDSSKEEERLLKAPPTKEVCVTGALTPTSIKADIVTYW